MSNTLSQEQIDFLKQHWPFEGEIKFHRRVANFVYFTQLNGRDAVLRLTELIHRNKKEIDSELDWMSYLTQNGMRIASPVKSTNGELAVEMPDGKTFACVFEKVQGVSLRDEAISDDIIRTWGQYLGKMNRLTKSYKPSAGIQPRQHWRQDTSMAEAMQSLDKNDRIPYLRFNELIEWMGTLPQDKNCYGLVHTDLHNGNFLVEDGQIAAFDFDDSCYQWFSYDIVIPVRSIANSAEVWNDQKQKVLETFLSGYNLENNLDSIWTERIRIFDMYRTALQYHWVKTFATQNIYDEKALEWVRENTPKWLAAMETPIQLF